MKEDTARDIKSFIELYLKVCHTPVYDDMKRRSICKNNVKKTVL